MSKNMKILLIVFGIIVGLFIALIVLASVLITPERVRETVVPLAEDALNRKVELGSIDVSLLSGISLQDMAVQRRDGQGQFISAEKVVLRYSLLALLMLKVEVDEINLVKPNIEIIRKADGSFNFSDLTESDGDTMSPTEKSYSGESSSINLLVSRVNITDGRLLFVDYTVKGTPGRHEIKAFNLKANNVSTNQKFPLDLSADWNGNSLGLAGQVDLQETGADVDLRFNKIKIHVSGGMKGDKIRGSLQLSKTTFADIISSIPTEYDPGLTDFDLKGNIALNLDLDNDTVKTTGFVIDINGQVVKIDLDAANLYATPIKVNFKANSVSLDVDKMIPATTRQQDQTSASTAQKSSDEVGPFDIPLDLDGEAHIGKVIYQGIPVTDLMLKINLRKNMLWVENLSTLIAGGQFRKTATVNLGVKGLKYSTEIDLKGVQGAAIIKMLKPELAESVAGLVGGEFRLSGAGTLPDTAKKKLTGQGAIRLADGKLQKIPALNSVAALLGVSELREVVLDDGNIGFAVKNGQVSIDSNISGPTTRLDTTGQVGLDGGLDLRSKMSLSPELGGRLHEQGKMVRYLGNENGWTTVPLRIKGSYDNPDVGLDSKGLKKQAEKAVQKEVQRKLEQELNKKLKGLFGN